MLSPFMVPDIVEAGCDEAGRGCLFGPVCCAAVILPSDFSHADINDSKKLSQAKREELRKIIEENALAWSVVMVEAEEIDRINILNASIEGMHRALNKLSVHPDHIIVDGNRFKPYGEIPYTTVVKGDSKFLSIAAASILAKTHRDELMDKLHEEYPQYGLNVHKGYPTKRHREAISLYGLSPLHRKTFRALK